MNMTKEYIFMRDILTKEHEFFIGKPDRINDAINQPDEFNITRMIEKSLAFQSNGLYTFVDADGYDFSDLSDAKTATVRMNNYNTGQCRVSIQNVGTKIGALRLIVFNPFTATIDYFFIPSSQKHRFCTVINKSGLSTIEVPWSQKNGYNKLNQFRVSSFKELATSK